MTDHPVSRPPNIVSLPGRDRHGPGEAALREVIEAYERRLHRYLASKVPADDIPDVLQETWGRLARVLGADPEAVLSASYVFKTADNIVRDQYRRRKVRQQDDHVMLDAEHLAENAPSPLEHLRWRQSLARVRAAFDSLPPLQRRIVLLHRIDGMSLPEVARELGVPLRTVERNLSRALAKCRMELEEAGWFSQT